MAKGSSRLLIFILAVGVFGILNTEMGLVGIIPQVSECFGVSVSDAFPAGSMRLGHGQNSTLGIGFPPM